MSLNPELAELTAEIISATVRPELWPEICERLTQSLGATGFMIFEYDFDKFGGQTFHSSVLIARNGAKQIAATLNGMPQEEMDAFALFARQPSGRIVSEYEIYGVDHDLDMPPNPFRDEVLKLVGSKSRNVARVNDVGPWSDVAALHLPYFGAEMPQDIRDTMNFLIPVIGKAFEAGRIVRRLTGLHAALLDAFDRFDFGAALVDGAGRVVIANRAFRELGAERDGLSCVGNMAGATHMDDAIALRGIVTGALDPRAQASELITTLRRPSGELPLVAKAAPVR